MGIPGRLFGLGDKSTNKAETRASELRALGFTPISESTIIDEGIELIRKHEGKYHIEIEERYQSNISPRFFYARVHTYTHEHSAGDDIEEDDFLILRTDRSLPPTVLIHTTALTGLSKKLVDGLFERFLASSMPKMTMNDPDLSTAYSIYSQHHAEVRNVLNNNLLKNLAAFGPFFLYAEGNMVAVRDFAIPHMKFKNGRGPAKLVNLANKVAEAVG